MLTITITIPADLEAFVRDRVAEGGYGSAADYIRDLIRADRRRQVEGRLDALLREGIESGAPIDVTPGYWESKKRTLVAGHGDE